jgi:5-methyltetrahydropteroyltriglutamate--homocysteine methyltransferase
MVCRGPVSYKGQAAVQTDIANLQAALQGLDVEEAFIPASAPRGLAGNEFYKTTADFIFAVAEALNEEYKAIVDGGFLLQIDDPGLTMMYANEGGDLPGEAHVEAINLALRGIDPDRVRFHTCYGINEGPRVFDTPLEAVLPLIYKINCTAYSFEAANPRHEHEWRAFQNLPLPEGKIIIPGVITHISNMVEHPRLIADRLVRYANIVGRENVIAGADCGFSSEARWNPDVHPTVVWAKFEAMVEGARIASEELWGQ